MVYFIHHPITDHSQCLKYVWNECKNKWTCTMASSLEPFPSLVPLTWHSRGFFSAYFPPCPFRGSALVCSGSVRSLLAHISAGGRWHSGHEQDFQSRIEPGSDLCSQMDRYWWLCQLLNHTETVSFSEKGDTTAHYVRLWQENELMVKKYNAKHCGA